MPVEQNSGFSTLPPEMKSMIFANLYLSDLRSARSVCKNWREIIDARNARFAVAMTNDKAKYVINSRVKFDSLHLRNLTGFPGMKTSLLRRILPSTERLVVATGNSEEAIFSFLEVLESSKLEIRDEGFSKLSGFKFSRFLISVNWNSLSQVSFEVEKSTLAHIQRVSDVLRIVTIPKLTNFRLYLVHGDPWPLSIYSQNLQGLLIEFLGFLYRHRNTLLLLTLNLYSINSFSMHPCIASWLDLIRTSNMNIAEFNTCFRGCKVWIAIGLSCIVNSGKLRTLGFDINQVEGYDFIQQTIEQIVEKNVDTLEFVRINMSTGALNFHCFRNCKRLSVLKIYTKNINLRPALRFAFQNLKYFEVTVSRFDDCLAKLVAGSMKNLTDLTVIDYGNSDVISFGTIILLLHAQSLVQVWFAWGLQLPLEFELRIRAIRGLKWSVALFGGICLTLDRSIFNISELHRVWPNPGRSLMDSESLGS